MRPAPGHRPRPASAAPEAESGQPGGPQFSVVAKDIEGGVLLSATNEAGGVRSSGGQAGWTPPPRSGSSRRIAVGDPGYSEPMALAHKLATAADLLALAGEGAFEITAGEVVEKAAPSGEHSAAQSATLGQLWPRFHRKPGGGEGGWWILVEVEIQLETHEIIRPDIAGWRRERLPLRPTGFPVLHAPDWVCEILSPSTARRDLGPKRRLLHAHRVPWYWAIDPLARFVQVLRWTPEGYLVETTAGPGEHPRLPPFEAMELDVGRLFGEED